MTNKLDKELDHALWGDLRHGNSFPDVRPLLAHYTSITVFEQMMGNNEIWFSNPLFMNDLEELRFGMNEGGAAFRAHEGLREACQNNNYFSKLIGYYDYLFQEFDEKHALDTYVLCLSEHDPADQDGTLSMWRGYGANGSGVALVFDTSKVEVDESLPLLIIDRVHYGTQEQRRKWIDEKIMSIANIIKKHSLTDEKLFHVAHFWIERLKLFSLFSKHSGFHEEKEWRVVYLSQRDRDKTLHQMFGFAITPRGVEPKLKLKVQPLDGIFSEDLSLEKIVDRIILGPTTSTVLAANAIKRMLVLKGKHALADKVVPSSIPFRP